MRGGRFRNHEIPLFFSPFSFDFELSRSTGPVSGSVLCAFW
nr:MAG TPA: hypothetical protein [Caudoviricetes sp.]DAY19646.1 MAG TPA: hypothetical protein [Caudoviricetes sp.]